MNSKLLRITALMLALVLSSMVFFSCSGETAGKDDGTEPAADTTEDTTETEKPVDTTPIAEAEVGSVISFGSYEQDNNTENGMEPILWKVLAKEDDKLLVITRDVIDCRRFDCPETIDYDWATSELAEYLNGEFVETAFTADEQTKLVDTELPPPSASPVMVSNVVDEHPINKVFLLDLEQVQTYLPTDADRIADATGYASAKKVFKGEDAAEDATACWWWTRSPGYRGHERVLIREDGSIREDGVYYYFTHCGVRPAAWISAK